MIIDAAIWRKGHRLQETRVEDFSNETRTHKVLNALDEVCQEFDLAHPIWLEKNIRDFQKRAKCRFTQDSFVEEVPFDYLSLEIEEEDY